MPGDETAAPAAEKAGSARTPAIPDATVLGIAAGAGAGGRACARGMALLVHALSPTGAERRRGDGTAPPHSPPDGDLEALLAEFAEVDERASQGPAPALCRPYRPSGLRRARLHR